MKPILLLGVMYPATSQELLPTLQQNCCWFMHKRRSFKSTIAHEAHLLLYYSCWTSNEEHSHTHKPEAFRRYEFSTHTSRSSTLPKKLQSSVRGGSEREREREREITFGEEFGTLPDKNLKKIKKLCFKINLTLKAAGRKIERGMACI
jgi:hypothetical protein